MMIIRGGGAAVLVVVLCVCAVGGSPLLQDVTDEKTAARGADEANPSTDQREVQKTLKGPHDEGDFVKEDLDSGAKSTIVKRAAEGKQDGNEVGGMNSERIISNDRYTEQRIHARLPRDLKKEEEPKFSGVDASSSVGINLRRNKQGSRNPKRKTGGAAGKKSEQASEEPTEQEKLSCDEQQNRTPKQEGRARRPRDLTAEDREASQRYKRDTGTTDESTGKVPKNRPTKKQKSTNGTQSGEVKKPQGRARRPRDVAEGGPEILKGEVGDSPKETGPASSDGQTEQEEQSNVGEKNEPQKQGRARRPRDLPAQESEKLSGGERGSGTQKQNSGNTMEKETGKELNDSQTKLEKQSSNGPENWTLKKQARARRPRDLNAEESESSRRHPRGAGATDADTKKVPPKKPTKMQKPTNETQSGEVRKPQGRARRPRGSPQDEELEKVELETESSVTNEPTDSPHTESGPRRAERSVDEPAVADLESADREPTEEEEAHTADDSSSPGEVEETTTELPETEPAAEPESSLQSEGSVGTEDSSGRRRRHVSLKEENPTQGEGKFGELPTSEVDDSVTSLSRSKRQQMGFLHYRKPNPAAFNGKPYTGQPWPQVSRWSNNDKLLP